MDHLNSSLLFYPLPEAITRKQMPVTINMVRPQDLLKWFYLLKVHIPFLYADIDLLTGTNVPNLLHPWEVINSQENGLYAGKTVLGWLVKSNFNHELNCSRLEELLMNQCNHDFCKNNNKYQ